MKTAIGFTDGLLRENYLLVFALREGSDDASEKNQLNMSVEGTDSKIPKQDMTIIIDGFNAQIGSIVTSLSYNGKHKLQRIVTENNIYHVSPQSRNFSYTFS